MPYLYEDLTDKIIGILFEVYNGLGWKYREVYYERAIIKEAKNKNIPVTSQVSCPIKYKSDIVGYNRGDLLFYGKIVVELKVGDRFVKKDFDQINEYLHSNNLELGLLVLISEEGVKIKRILNIK